MLDKPVDKILFGQDGKVCSECVDRLLRQSESDAVSMQLRMKQHIRLRMQLRTQNEYSVYN